MSTVQAASDAAIREARHTRSRRESGNRRHLPRAARLALGGRWLSSQGLLLEHPGRGREAEPVPACSTTTRSYDYAPTERPRGVGVHPHRGFETVTIAWQGSVAHHDSTGSGGVIGPGDAQWMTAASGHPAQGVPRTRATRAAADRSRWRSSG